MYAARKVYVKQWDFQKPEERYAVQVTQGGKLVPGIQPNRLTAVEEEVMYWRKANHIHAWFVDHVQQGQDDQLEHRVEWDTLRLLLSTCDKVLKESKLVDGTVYAGTVWKPGMAKAEEQRIPGKVIADSSVAESLLPTRAGFFFGSYEYDESYLDDVKRTRDWAMDMLSDYLNGVPGDIYYSSSW